MDIMFAAPVIIGLICADIGPGYGFAFCPSFPFMYLSRSVLPEVIATGAPLQHIL